ncbi:imidazole glycerol phosphate synthase subunit HisH [Rhodothermus profundi]|uniref:Imidazole glycerol phosphate synthase subunit HisH n=1 Tax=Rhodothermus profundi TaxID=633813 RepID=A0A1M6PW70_9BACT|nr:imidazole glycerol phosphate synthase subunit HisH [Rhodothermus profundi]SHK12234.1 glutamine amidotransferase [Rhodothermus profundi]
MVTLIDYGIGNLRSLEKAFQAVGAEVQRTDQPDALQRARRLVLPGVGAFGACMAELHRRRLIAPIREAVRRGIPLLGVCAGLQLLFEESEEHGRHEGLGLLPGRVVRFPEATSDGQRLKVPHMGWNTITPHRPSPLLNGIPAGTYFYFVHSYYAVAADPNDVLATSCYGGVSFPAIVGRGRVFGVQFHPEKSQQRGLRILKNFLDLSA